MPSFFALHGFTGSERSFDALGLSDLHCALLGGHGPAPCVTRATFAEEVAHWCRVVREQNNSPVHLLGYSQGARIALGMLIEAPDLFSAATLIGVNPGLESASAREERQTWEAEWIRILECEGVECFERAWSNQAIFESQRTLPSSVLDSQREERLQHTGLGLAHALRSLGLGHMPELWSQLQNMSVPTRLIFGENDEKFRAIALRMQEQNLLFQVSEVPGAGHNPIREYPENVRTLITWGET